MIILFDSPIFMIGEIALTGRQISDIFLNMAHFEIES